MGIRHSRFSRGNGNGHGVIQEREWELLHGNWKKWESTIVAKFPHNTFCKLCVVYAQQYNVIMRLDCAVVVWPTRTNLKLQRGVNCVFQVIIRTAV